eukprot:Skav233439  [mRNA]  locus=scaffold1486:315325:316231:- [translate_table: standard]
MHPGLQGLLSLHKPRLFGKYLLHWRRRHWLRQRGECQAHCIMIEDQVAPKRCGHTKGTTVVPRAEAIARVRAACDARDEGQAGAEDGLNITTNDCE